MSSERTPKQSENWKELILELEQQIMGGQKPDLSEYEVLPESFKLQSPLVLQTECVRLIAQGSYMEAKDRLMKAIKGYALQGNPADMLSMMGLYALLLIRVGEANDSEAILEFLRQEYKRSPELMNGYALWALARNAADDADGYFLEAAAFFHHSGDPAAFAELLLDRWIYDPETIRSKEWEGWLLHLHKRSLFYPICRAAVQVIHKNEIPSDAGVLLPSRYVYLTRAILQEEDLTEPDKQLAYDEEVQLFAVHFSLTRQMPEHAAASEAVRQAELRLHSVRTPAAARLVEEMKGRFPGPPKQAAGRNSFPSAAADKWNIQLMAGIRFYREGGTRTEPQWKRRKAKELLVYLLLQPGYRALREQAVEQVFGEGEAAKLANHLYVSLHELRHTLRQMGIANMIYARGGFIGVNEQNIDVVDVEQYSALTRVGDQLWTDDREAAARMYEEAAGLYGLLGADMPYVEWLDQWRRRFIERHAVVLKRIAEYYTSVQGYNRAEYWLTEWITLRPDQEEAYQAIIRHCKDQGRKAEAVSWYKRLERVCKDELGTEPLEETKKLVSD